MENAKGTKNTLYDYEHMVVATLREISRERGLTLESHGHKFTKAELIERLQEWDRQVLEQEEGEAKEGETEIKETEQAGQEEIKGTEENNYIPFAETLDEIEQKYSVRKPQYVYDEMLKVGSLIAFVHYVEALNGNIYKKLRTAKATKINRKKELVVVETLLGTVKELHFDELLYIREPGDTKNFPRDINAYLKKQRTEKGRQIINEKFGTVGTTD